LTKKRTFRKLKGIPASRGYYEGNVKVIKGIEEFNRIKDEDVLIIPCSDVSWNPLFMKAKAIISESCGILPHCSIVAREYNIPAVVSVNDATRIQNGTRVAVNGYNGEILTIE
jgi:phosphoenolpyruvate synthase/pyruvate phosphate dikinase